MRRQLKQGLGLLGGRRPAEGVSLLIYHRVSGTTPDELDIPPGAFAQHVEALAGVGVRSLGEALDANVEGAPGSFVLTFDDGFRDVYDQAWPLLREHRLPFTVYLASGFVGGTMQWEGSTSRAPGGPALTWEQLGEMVESGLCTVGNHTHDHVRPEALTPEQLDRCSDTIERELGVRPEHFTYPWGIEVPAMEPALRERFRSASTGQLGRNQPGCDPYRLKRIPVRRTDPDSFYRAKLRGGLRPERTYAGMVAAAKRLGLSA